MTQIFLDPKHEQGLLFRAPKYVGGWRMPGCDGYQSITFNATKKPRWLTRKLMWYLMEWKWIDF